MVEVEKIERLPHKGNWEVWFTEDVTFEGRASEAWVLPGKRYPDRMAAFVWAQKVIEEQERGGDNGNEDR